MGAPRRRGLGLVLKAHARETWRSPFISPRHGDLVLFELRDAPSRPEHLAWLPGIEGVLAVVEGTIRAGRDAEARGQLAVLEGPLGPFGQYRNFLGRFRRDREPAAALALFEEARRTGFRDLIFFEDLAAVADRARRPEAAARARADRARLVGA